MLRAVKSKYVGWGLKGIRAQSAQAAPTPPRKPSSATSKVLYSVGALATVAVGVIGYAYVDPEFKKKVETTVPQVKPYFDAWFGSSHNTNVGQLLSDLKDKVAHAIPVAKKEKNVEGVREKEPPVHLEPSGARGPMETENVKVNSGVAAERVAEFESSLLSAIHSAEDKVRAATDAKIRTIAAINEHASLVKETVDESQNADWGKVTTALQQAEWLASRDGKAEADGRNYIDYLRTIISRGKSDPVTASNPLLLNATETANKLSHQLDELDGLVFKARQESTISNQYKDLVQRSREQFAQEVKNILPNVDINVKNKNMEPEELNALIAHAHLKVDNLRRQLLEQQVREEQHIARAIADQREADERIAAERLENELQRIQQQQDVEIERAVLQKRSLWQNELEEQLRRSAAAHSEHLEQIIRTQRQLFEIEHNQKIEEASRLERDRHSREVGVALSRLAGIESALDSRVALDMENRRAKQFWIACHNLIGSIKHGNKSGEDMDKRRFPLDESLSFFKQCECEDDFVAALITAFPEVSKNKGLYTEQDLKNRFDKIYKLGRRTATIGSNGGTLTGYIRSYIKSLLQFDLQRKFSDHDMIDPSTLDNLEILARAKWYVDRDDLEGAIRISQLLKGEAAQAIRDWLGDARAHLEARLLAQILVAHSAVSSMRSIY